MGQIPQPGQRVALLGATGSGKTSIIIFGKTHPLRDDRWLGQQRVDVRRARAGDHRDQSDQRDQREWLMLFRNDGRQVPVRV